VLEVRPDGSGEYPTIQAAIDASVDGDTIELLDGTFFGDGNRDLHTDGKAITLRSQSGNAETCVIDCQGSAANPHRGFLFDAGETNATVVAGLGIRGGYAGENGGGICALACAPTIRGCVFRENTARESGGGIALSSVYDPGLQPLMERCRLL
jgi:hypothetical protein